jgi:hypothetical protein
MEKLENSAIYMFLVVNEAEEQKFIFKKSKFQQILGNMFSLELSVRVFPLVLIVGQSKKSGNWRKFHASANQISESAEIYIF